MNRNLKDYQRKFIELAIACDVLRFGEFELKSGRISPYFFNAGQFSSGKSLAVLGECYADAIEDYSLDATVLFGPAYKGIPLVAVTAAALYTKHGRDLPFCFNRKELKSHGEGGQLVGASLDEQRVLILDDVITAGTAVREVTSLIAESNAKPSGVLLGLDRDERANDSDQSAVQQLETEYAIPVKSIISLSDIRAYLAGSTQDGKILAKIDAYREKYGV